MSGRDYRAVSSTPRLQSGDARLFDQTIRFTDSTGFLHSVRELFYDEVYRFKAKTATPFIIDAGANIGLSIIYFKRLYPGCTILAYEPDHMIFDALRRNTAGLEGIELREAAAWIEDTELTFYSEGSLAGSVEIDNAGMTPVRVKAERLKDQLRDKPVDFLKIDIEGAENSVLFDIEDELANVEHLFFEYHSLPDRDQQLGELLNLVSRAGYRYAIGGPHGPRLPFVEKVSGFDLQLNVSCFRN